MSTILEIGDELAEKYEAVEETVGFEFEEEEEETVEEVLLEEETPFLKELKNSILYDSIANEECTEINERVNKVKKIIHVFLILFLNFSSLFLTQFHWKIKN
jgi:hypothetical protein